MYDQSVIDIFKDCFCGTQLKLFDEEKYAMHPSPECRFYGFNIRAVSE